LESQVGAQTLRRRVLVSAAPAILRDVRFAIKSLGRSPGFTLIAIIALGLGIGANTSMFSILNDYMWRYTPGSSRQHLARRLPRSDPRIASTPTSSETRDEARPRERHGSGEAVER
jgi:hypothetical protein